MHISWRQGFFLSARVTHKSVKRERGKGKQCLFFRGLKVDRSRQGHLEMYTEEKQRVFFHGEISIAQSRNGYVFPSGKSCFVFCESLALSKEKICTKILWRPCFPSVPSCRVLCLVGNKRKKESVSFFLSPDCKQ